MLEDFIEKFEKLYIIIILCNMELSIFRRNGNQYFSCDESEFSHYINGESIWVLGMTNNTTKDFRVVATKIRDTIHLKEFITRYISPGNKIITDGWAGYDWADSPNSGYIRYRHIHGQDDLDSELNPQVM